MTLSPVAGRRPNYTIFSVDIGVNGVTLNSCLFAVTSATCSTLLKQLLIVTTVFAPPIDMQQALATPSQCADSSSCRQKLCTRSHKLRDIYIPGKSHIQQDTRYIRGILMRVASVGCFPGAWRLGSWHFQVASLHLQSSTDFLFSASDYYSFLGKRSGRRMPPAERSALYLLLLLRRQQKKRLTLCLGQKPRSWRAVLTTI